MARKLVFRIPKSLVWKAFEDVKGTVGTGGKYIRGYRKTRLLQLWNQLSLGQYNPAPFSRAYKRKGGGKWRTIGVPTDTDNIVLTMLKNKMVSKCYSLYYPNSFFHKRGNKKQMAVEAVHKKCLRYNWVLYLDIKNYGESINHRILMRFLKLYFKAPWVLLYTYRLLQAPTRMKNGRVMKRTKGVPANTLLSFLFGDFYLHHIFDQWMKRNHPTVLFERWIDDIVIHCQSEAAAKQLLAQIENRLRRFGLEKNSRKTKIIYCKDGMRKGTYKNVSFQFLQHTFRARRKKSRLGKFVEIFSPK